MKKVVVILLISIILVASIICFISAECQYKDEINSGVYKQVLYDFNGTKYENPIIIDSFRCSCLENDCNTYFNIKNIIDKNVNIRIFYQIMITNGVGSTVHNRDKNILISKQFLYIETDKVNWQFKDCYILQDSISYVFISNNETIAMVEELKNITCKKCGIKDCLNDGDLCTYDFECGSNVCSNTGNTAGHCISQRSDFEKRLLALESWRLVVNNTLLSVQTSVSNMLLTLTGHTTKLNDYENRISKLENQTLPSPNYIKYLSLTERKKMVCGYAIDNHLSQYGDLGVSCFLVYKPRGNPSCKCIEK
jgi:hypothetical protein